MLNTNINSDYKWLNNSRSIYLKQHPTFTKQRYVIHFALQFINIVVNLLDALKTSFSHRSMAARSLGKKDSVSEAAVAGLSLLKVWINIFCLDKNVASGQYTEPHSPEKYLDL
jgi:hypothetical protein